MIKRAVCFLLMTAILFTVMNGTAEDSSFKSIVSFLRTSEPLNYRLHIEYGKLPQFDDTRVQQLNNLLKHFSFQGTVANGEKSVTVMLDEEELFSCFEMDFSGKIVSALSTEPQLLYILPDGENQMAGNLPDISLFSFDAEVFDSLDTCLAFFSGLPSGFPEKASSVKTAETIQGFGRTARKTTVIITGEELEAYISEHQSDFSDFSILSELTKIHFDGRQSFSLLFTEEDRLIKISYSGKAGSSTDDMRNVRIDWKTVRNENLEKDDLQIRTPNAQGTRRNNFLLSYEWKTTDEGFQTFTWSAEKDQLAEGKRTRVFSDALMEGNDHRITGVITNKTAASGLTESTEAQISISLLDNNSCNGTLEIIDKKDKIEENRFIIDFDLSDGSAARVSSVQPDIVTVSETEFKGITDRLVSRIVTEMLQLPDEDLLFIKYGIPEGIWKEIVPGINE